MKVVGDEVGLRVLGSEFLFFVAVLGGLLTEAIEEVGADSPGGLRVRGFKIGGDGQGVCERGNGHTFSPL